MVSFLQENGNQYERVPVKGSYSALNCYYLTFIDETFAKQQYETLKSLFWKDGVISGLKEYYDRKKQSGFDYAYRYPGMNKVLQAAGRVIRTKEDKGVILLLDDRFLGRDYGGIFPREWKDRSSCRLNTVEEAVSRFWRSFT